MSDDTKQRDDEDQFDQETQDTITASISSLMKRAIVGGVSTVFLTQEKARNVLKDLKLPKEVLDGLLSNAQKTKEEFFQGVSKELVKVLDKVDVVEEGRRFLSDHTIKVHVELEFNPKKKPKSD